MSPLSFRISDLSQMLRPEGPLFAYLVPWTLVLIGQQMALSLVIVPEYSSMYLVVLGNMVSVVVLAVLLQMLSPFNLAVCRSLQVNPTLPKQVHRRLLAFFCLYVALEALQVLYFKGFPLLWLVFKTVPGAVQDYATYGIPTLNGFVHALYLFASSLLFIVCLSFNRIALYLCLFLTMLVPILLVSRHLLICVFVQTLCLWLYYRPRAIRWAMICAVLVLSLFIVVGNLRTGLESMLHVFPPSESVPKALYGLMWVYAYIVTPFNSLNSNADTLTPVGWPYHELSATLPSVLRTRLLEDITVPDTNYITLLPGQVNTFYYEPVLDMGVFYGFLFMAVFQLLTICAFRRAVRTGWYLDVLTYSVLYQVMVLSVFHNHLLYQPVIFQLVLLSFLRWKFRPTPTYLKALPQ